MVLSIENFDLLHYFTPLELVWGSTPFAHLELDIWSADNIRWAPTPNKQ